MILRTRNAPSLPILAICVMWPNFASATFPLPCPNGAWDLGPRVAALSIECRDDTTATLSFCKRERLQDGLACNHIGRPISCEVSLHRWLCEDKADGYTAEIHWAGKERIRFRFQSRFSSGEHAGSRFEH